MVKSHPQHCFVHFAVDYEPRYRLKLLEITDRLHQSSAPELIQHGPTGNLFRWPSQSRTATLAMNRFAVSTLGLTAWEASVDLVREAVSMLCEELPLTTLKRVGFKIDAYAPIGLSHAECIDLLFGSFLAERTQVLNALGATELDPILIFEATLPESREAKFEFASMSADQFRTIASKMNLDVFAEKPLLDENVKNFLNGMMDKDLFAYSIDLFVKDLASNDFESFLSTCVDRVDEMGNRMVSLIKSKPSN